MPHRKFEFLMPARADIVFDAFHHHAWRKRWDSLVGQSSVIGGAPCPYVGAETENIGSGALRGLSMRTRFVTFDRPRLAAASMIDRAWPFERWAASMKHRAVAGGESSMIYTYSFETRPRWLRWIMEPVVVAMFDRQTRQRFGHFQAFLRDHAAGIAAWQDQQQVESVQD
jgi:hypothetical protein